MKMPNLHPVLSHLVAVFGVVLLVLGCTNAQKQAAQKALAATTQPIGAVQTGASNIAAVTPPGSLPNDVAQIVMAITGSLLVVERIANTVVANLPTKDDSGNTSPTGNALAVVKSVETSLNSATSGSPAVPIKT